MQNSSQNSTAIVQVDGAIRNPGNPNHLMVMRPVSRVVRVYFEGTLIAQTQNALRVIEMGKSIYDPALYIPAADLLAPLQLMDKSSHCPLKGDASAATLNGNEIAWTYDRPFDTSKQLAGHFAFWPDKVKITEGD
jgi:uncharacterized protein (DUF427 family)